MASHKQQQLNNRFTALCPGLPGWASTRINIHLLTPTLIIRHPLSTFSVYYNPQHPPCSIYMLDSHSGHKLIRNCCRRLHEKAEWAGENAELNLIVKV